MRPDAIDVSVVVVSYNTRELLAACLRSVVEQTPGLLLELIVVDNGSTDGSLDMLRAAFPAVRLIANGENLGFATATNQGIRASSGRLVLLLNPDTVVLDRAIERMAVFMDERPHVGACGCRLIFPDGAFQPSAFPFPSVWSALYEYSGAFEHVPALARRLVRGWIDPRPEQTRPVMWCSGACLMVSRACIGDVGLLDPGFFMYSEEVDWCRRMQRSAWQVYYLADAVVVHYLGRSQADGSYGRRLRQLRGELHYLRKWHGAGYAAAYRIVVAVCGLYHYAKHSRILAARTAPDEVSSAERRFYWALATERV